MIVSNMLIIALVLARLPAFLSTWRSMLSRGLLARGRVDTVVGACMVAVLGALFWPLYSSRMIPMADGKMWSGGSCWADLPIHMHIAEAFLQGRNVDVSAGALHSPVFAGERLYYPFLPDFHAATVKRLGGELRDGFLVPGWAMACSLWALLYFFSLRVTRSRIGAVLSVAILIGAGGTGGPSVLWNRGIGQALEVDTAQNDVDGNYRIFWFAFMPHVLLPQRGANFAYPMVLLVLLLVWSATDVAMRTTPAIRRSGLMHAAAFAAMLPLVQVSLACEDAGSQCE